MKKLINLLCVMFIFTSHQASAGRIADSLHRSCERSVDNNVLNIKFLLTRFYEIKNGMLSGRIERARAEVVWTEEFERYMDFRYDNLKKINDSTWRDLDAQSKDILNIQYKMHGTAILQAASEFYSLNSMPPDIRISRVFIEKCQSLASASSR